MITVEISPVHTEISHVRCILDRPLLSLRRPPILVECLERFAVAFYYGWKRRLVAEQRPPMAGDEAVPLPVYLTPSPAPVELVLPSGAMLWLSPGCDLDFVRSQLAALGGTPC